MNGGSVFKGEIPPGTVRAEFLSDAGNVDADILVAMYKDLTGGAPVVARDVTVPGGQVEVEVHASDDGVLEVWVAIGDPADSGHLRVTVDGAPEDDEAIQGSVRWVYSVDSSVE